MKPRVPGNWPVPEEPVNYEKTVDSFDVADGIVVLVVNLGHGLEDQQCVME